MPKVTGTIKDESSLPTLDSGCQRILEYVHKAKTGVKWDAGAVVLNAGCSGTLRVSKMFLDAGAGDRGQKKR